MKRNVITLAGLAFLMLTFGCGSTRAPEAQTNKTFEPLPAIEGLEVVAPDTVRKKPGFEFEKQPDGTYMVRRAAETGGGGGKVPFNCSCTTGDYACETRKVDDDTLKCYNVRDCLSCKFGAARAAAPRAQ